MRLTHDKNSGKTAESCRISLPLASRRHAVIELS